MTKAEKIFKATRYECTKHIEVWGYEVNPNGKAVGFNRVITEEAVYTRTLNELDKMLARAKKDIERYVKLGIFTEERAEKERQILNMVETTIENTRAARI